MLRRFLGTAITLLIISAVVAAGNVHFVGSLSFSVNSPLRVQGKLAGLGGESITVIFDATATVYALCQSRGGNIAPGRNPITVETTVTSSYVVSGGGQAEIDLIATDPSSISPTPVSPNPKEAGCPNGRWTVVGVDPNMTQWTAAAVTVIDNQTGGALYSQSFTCSGTGSGVCTPN